MDMTNEERLKMLRKRIWFLKDLRKKGMRIKYGVFGDEESFEGYLSQYPMSDAYDEGLDNLSAVLNGPGCDPFQIDMYAKMYNELKEAANYPSARLVAEERRKRDQELRNFLEVEKWT